MPVFVSLILEYSFPFWHSNLPTHFENKYLLLSVASPVLHTWVVASFYVLTEPFAYTFIMEHITL